jgi:phosphate starvation-inducible membrane PsiE
MALIDEDKEVTSIGRAANRAFLGVETIAYMILGAMLAVTAFLGIASAAVALVGAALLQGDSDAVVFTIDRLLFVLMVVEILHTVRVSFRSGTLVCEPFLIVGLIASIRRVLVITLESSQVNQPGKWTPDTHEMLSETMLELGVLGGLILVMVVSIYILRKSERPAGAK